VALDIAADLERKGLLVAREGYLHSYPVCWRCGTQLVFRLVDEWFIRMDPLREPIAEVTRQIHWLPEGIGLEERELDWLRNMGDWMISKKRYYGLALPIWVCQDCEAWEVIGGRDELRDRAVAGWEAFEGHTPHRPWVDAVEIACTSCGGRSRRIADVGNPWLDAGIVGFSTLRWNTDREYWREWFPADFVTESFPGQFRNWFYALLTMSTVLANEPMTQTIFGYALVRDEHGDEMHKSKANSIPFDEGAERIGADVMRWMFSAANPAVNLNFGYGPGHEVVRRFFLPLWNTYAFFVSYARLDGWLPSAGSGVADGSGRSLLDRWILSRLDAVTSEVRAALDAYDALRATRAVEAFVEDLSTWYVRRNRRRFWKGELDADKAAAYQTLYEVLATLTRLVAPFVPHLADAIWENLVAGVDVEAPDSVHLSDFPTPAAGRRDEALEAAVARARRVVALGHAARSASGIRVRQPLPAVRLRRSGGGGLSDEPAVDRELTAQVLDELNVKSLELIPDESVLIERTLRPLLPVLGPRRGSDVAPIMAAAKSGTWRQLDDGRVEAGGLLLEPDEFELIARARGGHELAEEADLLIALDTSLTPELEAEGLAREVAHRLQGLRKTAGYELADRIAATVGGDPGLVEQLQPHRDWLAGELLADELVVNPEATLDDPDRSEELEVGGGRLRLAVRRA
jgi:isoleucyl-tRNA synthetase